MVANALRISRAIAHPIIRLNHFAYKLLCHSQDAV